ncbi:hypothetical protein ACIQU5_10045 [Streptomyces sp. NPDC090306]|uniref:hypothetical protein n=1 Tax=Streptomyces sp. NPDC090306 TaxID=3365961 RepID=UPI00381CE0F7
MRQTESERAPERAPDAEGAVARLRTALVEVGVVLPSLRVDPVTAVRGPGHTLVDLGSCNVGTADRLVAALGARAAREEQE